MWKKNISFAQLIPKNCTENLADNYGLCVVCVENQKESTKKTVHYYPVCTDRDEEK